MDGPAEDIRFPHDTPPSGCETTEVAPGILWIRLPLPMRLDHVNVYALDDGDGWTVIDTGFKNDRIQAIWSDLLDGPLAGKPLRRVVLTHHHPDHVGMAGWLAETRQAEIWATRTAWLMARMLTLDVQETISEQALTFYRRAGMEPRLLEERRTSRPFNFADAVHPIPLGFTRLSQGDTVQMGGRRWRVEIGHGHAPEHATFWCEEDGIVIAGDQVLPGISSNLGVYPTEPDADPVGDWMESCARLRTLARPDMLVLPGHKLPFTGLATRLDQLIDNHHGALARLRAHLDRPRTAHDCFAPLYKRRIGDGEYGLALVEAVGHLNHMARLGEVTRSLNAEGAYEWTMVQRPAGAL